MSRHLTIVLSADNLLNRHCFDFFKQPGTTALADVVAKFRIPGDKERQELQDI